MYHRSNSLKFKKKADCSSQVAPAAHSVFNRSVIARIGSKGTPSFNLFAKCLDAYKFWFAVIS